MCSSAMQAALYGIGAAVIAIITIAAYKLARSTNKRDPLLWGIFAVLAVVTAWTHAELAQFFLLAGLLIVLARARLGWMATVLVTAGTALVGLAIWLVERSVATLSPVGGEGNELLQILLFFTKAGAFVFGSGLAIVPFLNEGVVHQYGCLTKHQCPEGFAVLIFTPVFGDVTVDG